MEQLSWTIGYQLQMNSKDNGGFNPSLRRVACKAGVSANILKTETRHLTLRDRDFAVWEKNLNESDFRFEHVKTKKRHKTF